MSKVILPPKSTEPTVSDNAVKEPDPKPKKDAVLREVALVRAAYHPIQLPSGVRIDTHRAIEVPLTNYVQVQLDAGYLIEG